MPLSPYGRIDLRGRVKAPVVLEERVAVLPGLPSCLVRSFSAPSLKEIFERLRELFGPGMVFQDAARMAGYPWDDIEEFVAALYRGAKP